MISIAFFTIPIREAFKNYLADFFRRKTFFPEKLSGLSVKGGGVPPLSAKGFLGKSAK